MKKSNAFPASSLEKHDYSMTIIESIKDHLKKESYSVVADAHEQESCVNYEQSDMTLLKENL